MLVLFDLLAPHRRSPSPAPSRSDPPAPLSYSTSTMHKKSGGVASSERPVDESRARRLARLARVPALARQKPHQRIALEQRARVAVEQGLPDGADQQLGNRLVAPLKARTLQHDRLGHLRQLEPEEAVRRERQEIRVGGAPAAARCCRSSSTGCRPWNRCRSRCTGCAVRAMFATTRICCCASSRR